MARRTGSRPAASQRENNQHHEAEPDARRHHIKPQPRQAASRMGDPEPHNRTQQHQNGAGHDRHGSHDRQSDDETHPPGGDGTRAHRLTIALRLPGRKPYGQP
jgi:hypothetical protein